MAVLGGCVLLAYILATSLVTGSVLQPTEETRNCDDMTCPLDFSPVCGTDGKTYSNSCELTYNNCKQGTQVEIDYTGPCQQGSVLQPIEETRNCDDMICPLDFSPVCGKDGKTYSNSCELTYNNCKQGTQVEIDYTGPCQQEQSTSLQDMARKDCEDSVCAAVYSPVCGTDGKTYDSPCVLRASNCLHGTIIQRASYGPCETEPTAPPRETTSEDCDNMCITVYSPICGTDGKTYSNSCALRRSNCKDGTEIHKAHDGRCEDGPAGGDVVAF